MESCWYFAYGSNMNPARMAARGMRMLASHAAVLEGWELCFNKRAHGRDGVAYANVMPSAAGQVPGVLYQLRDLADVKRMDHFEGWPERYRREQMPIRLASRGHACAWVYIANPHWQSPGLLPERWYLNHLLSGRPWLPADHYRRLTRQPCLADGGAAEAAG